MELSTKKAKNLRQNSTASEKKLWYYLRAKRFGFKFKRQVPLGSYIVDFLCPEKQLVIELDGGQHASQQAYDNSRTDWLNSKGFQVLRFWNHDVLQNTSSVLLVIRNALHSSSSSDG